MSPKSRAAPIAGMLLDELRRKMVETHLASRGIRDQRMLEAISTVPRELFVRPGLEEFAYEDTPLPIGEGQTISQPDVVALMIEAPRIAPHDRVLAVGTRLAPCRERGVRDHRRRAALARGACADPGGYPFGL